MYKYRIEIRYERIYTSLHFLAPRISPLPSLFLFFFFFFLSLLSKLSLLTSSLPTPTFLTLAIDNQFILPLRIYCCSYISDGDDSNGAKVITAGVVPTLMRHLSCDHEPLIHPVLRIVGNLVSGSDESTQAVVDGGAIALIAPLLSHSKSSLRKEACWALSNIAAGSKCQIQSLMDCQSGRVVQQLVEFSSEEDWQVRKEAVITVCNAICGGNTSQRTTLVVNLDCIGAIVSVLDAKDVGTVLIALDALKIILKADEEDDGANFDAVVRIDDADGIDKLEALQEHANEKVYEASVNILENYFGGEEDDEDEDDDGSVEGGGGNNTFNFSLGSQQQHASDEGAGRGGGGGVFDFGGGSSAIPQEGFAF